MYPGTVPYLGLLTHESSEAEMKAALDAWIDLFDESKPNAQMRLLREVLAAYISERIGRAVKLTVRG